MMNDDENPDDILQTLSIYTTCQAEEAANYAIGDAKRTLNSRQAEAKETGGPLDQDAESGGMSRLGTTPQSCSWQK